MNLFEKIGNAPTGQASVVDSRFCTVNIRLSSALCCFGFGILLDRQPVGVTIDADNDQKIITFYHSDSSSAGYTFTARDIELWWSSPGKYSIEGYDDALKSIHRVFKEREDLIGVMRNPKRLNGELQKGSVATASLHTASVLASCEIKLVGYEPKTRRWIFSKGAELIAGLIKSGGQPKDQRPISNDLCIDWMLEGLKYHDWLKQIVKDPECIPLIEMRDGERILQISSGMDEREQRKWIARL